MPRGQRLLFMPLPLLRSTARSTKLGVFGELLLEHWLMRAGFHTAQADAEGLDVLATHSSLQTRIGLSMKTRFYEKPADAGILLFTGRDKLISSCATWGAKPWLCLYFESNVNGCLIAMALDHYESTYPKSDNNKWHLLDIRAAALDKLRQDLNVHIVELQLTGRWMPS